MMKGLRTLVVLLGTVGMFAVAQDQDVQMDFVIVSESEQYGEYLTDGEGRTLYVFFSEEAAAQPGSLEPMTEGVRPEAGSCSDACLQTWPPLLAGAGYTEEAGPGEGVDGDLLYTADIDGQTQIVYNGFPLYYNVEDQTDGEINGQGAAGRWFIIAPDGTPIRSTAGGGTGTDGGEADGTDGDGADGDGAEGNGAEGADEEGAGVAGDDDAAGAGDAEDVAGGGEGEVDGDGTAGDNAAGDNGAGDGAAGDGATDDGAAGGTTDDGATDDGTNDGTNDGTTDDTESKEY